MKSTQNISFVKSMEKLPKWIKCQFYNYVEWTVQFQFLGPMHEMAELAFTRGFSSKHKDETHDVEILVKQPDLDSFTDDSDAQFKQQERAHWRKKRIRDDKKWKEKRCHEIRATRATRQSALNRLINLNPCVWCAQSKTEANAAVRLRLTSGILHITGTTLLRKTNLPKPKKKNPRNKYKP